MNKRIERIERIERLNGVRFYQFSDWRGEEVLRDVRRIYGGSLHPITSPHEEGVVAEGAVFQPPYFGGSDYSGSTVTRANFEVFIAAYDEHDWLKEVSYGYAGYDICIDLADFLACDDGTFDEVMETLEGLEDYPLIDGGALCKLEMDSADEAWASWASSDFARAVERELELDGYYAYVEYPDDEDRDIFEDCAERANCYWEAECSGPEVHIDVSRVAGCVTYDDVAKYIVWPDWVTCLEYIWDTVLRDTFNLA